MRNTQRGFSLIEILVAMGLVGGLSLMTMSMTKLMHKGQVTSETKMEELEIRRLISTALLDKTACEKTFGGYSIGQDISAIKGNLGQDIFRVNGVYGNNTNKLLSLKTVDKNLLHADGTRDIDLIVTLKKMKSIVSGSNKTVTIPLKVKASSESSPITECFSNNEEVVHVATQESCNSLGGVWDPIGGKCSLDVFVKKSGDTMTGALNGPSGNFSSDVTSPKIKTTNICDSTGANCKPQTNLITNQTCVGPNVVSAVNENGVATCRSLSCPLNQYFAGLDSLGNPVCRPYPTNTCPTNEYVSEVRSDGTVVCSVVPNTATATCPAGKVLQSVNAGTPTCVNATVSCPAGEVLQSFSNGVQTCVPSYQPMARSCIPGTFVSAVKEDGSLVCTAMTATCPEGSTLTGINNGAAVCTVSSGVSWAAGTSCPAGKTVFAKEWVAKKCSMPDPTNTPFGQISCTTEGGFKSVAQGPSKCSTSIQFDCSVIYGCKTRTLDCASDTVSSVLCN